RETVRFREALQTLAKDKHTYVEIGPRATLATLDAISTARERIEGNVAPGLALESMLISAIREPVSSGKDRRL
ncbi:MAG: hypothetical protein ABL886_11505, partial [Rhodoglobus sp.]